MDANEKKQAASRRREAVAARKRSQQLRARVVRAFSAIIALALVFSLGFFLRGLDWVSTRLGLVTPGVSSTTATTASTKSTYDSVSARVSEVEDILSEKSLNEYDLDKATAAMLESLVETTDDPYLRYFTAERYDKYVRENSSTDYEGVGVLFAEYEGKVYAASVFPNSTAYFAGVQENDVVNAIDGEVLEDWTVNEVVSRIAAKDQVVITWGRPASLGSSSDTTFTTTLDCQHYSEPNITATLDDDIATLSISQLSQSSADMMRTSIEQLQSQGARAFVLDLRDCAGGYLSQAVDIASLFVKSGTLVQIKTVSGVTNKTASGDQIVTVPVVVLINEKTGAAAEVLAAALRDNGVAQLVGTTTLGKGSIQVVSKLSFGGAIRYTAGYYLSPLGHDIDGLGVSPDTVVADADTQASVAAQIASSLADEAAAQ